MSFLEWYNIIFTVYFKSRVEQSSEELRAAVTRLKEQRSLIKARLEEIKVCCGHSFAEMLLSWILVFIRTF